MTDAPASAAKPDVLSPGDAADLRQAVATFVEAGADESIQRVITAVHRLSRRLNQWYDRQLVDLDISTNEYLVISELARSPGHAPLTPSQLAAATNIAPSSMTHRLDRLVERGLITREQDPDNRTRVLIQLSDAGYALLRRGHPPVRHGGVRRARRSQRRRDRDHGRAPRAGHRRPRPLTSSSEDGGRHRRVDGVEPGLHLHQVRER